MKRLLWEMPDGSVRITIPRSKPLKDETESDYLSKIANKSRPHPDAKLYHGDKSDVPTDKTFRASWRLKSGKVETDMPLARAEKMESIRAERNKKLSNSDALMARANETNGRVSEWKAYRKSLRDIPADTDLDQASTPEVLKAYEPNWPTEP